MENGPICDGITENGTNKWEIQVNKKWILKGKNEKWNTILDRMINGQLSSGMIEN